MVVGIVDADRLLTTLCVRVQRKLPQIANYLQMMLQSATNL